MWKFKTPFDSYLPRRATVNEMKSCSKFFRNTATSRYFTDRNRDVESVYYSIIFYYCYNVTFPIIYKTFEPNIVLQKL